MTDPTAPAKPIKLALCGDVMTGRGIDQIQAHPGDPRLFEPYIKSALDYVKLAERKSGKIPSACAPGYIWGDALPYLQDWQPDAFIVNLETAVTRSNAAEAKGINYRMNPDNISCLTVAKIDCCALANNHVLDWGTAGLHDTLHTLSTSGLRFAGAGDNAAAAEAPTILGTRQGGRILVFSMGMPNSGIPQHWGARTDRPGICLLPDFSRRALLALGRRVRAAKRAGDIAIATIHWGGNWGYAITADMRAFAHSLVADCAFDLVHGHSSHHPLTAEIHRGKLILYGCGDFMNDYEGIGGFAEYRPDLALLYFAELKANSGFLKELRLIPFRLQRFRLTNPQEDDLAWLAARMSREYQRLNLDVRRDPAGFFTVGQAQAQELEF